MIIIDDYWTTYTVFILSNTVISLVIITCIIFTCLIIIQEWSRRTKALDWTVETQPDKAQAVAMDGMDCQELASHGAGSSCGQRGLPRLSRI